MCCSMGQDFLENLLNFSHLLLFFTRRLLNWTLDFIHSLAGSLAVVVAGLLVPLLPVLIIMDAVGSFSKRGDEAHAFDGYMLFFLFFYCFALLGLVDIGIESKKIWFGGASFLSILCILITIIADDFGMFPQDIHSSNFGFFTYFFTAFAFSQILLGLTSMELRSRLGVGAWLLLAGHVFLGISFTMGLMFIPALMISLLIDTYVMSYYKKTLPLSSPVESHL